MPRKTGYLANITALPPLIFRFQFNPVMLSEKKSFKYENEEEKDFGVRKWEVFPDTVSAWNEAGASVGAGFLGLLKVPHGLYKDVKNYGPLLTNVVPLVAKRGEPRTIALEFQLLAGTLVEGLASEDVPEPENPFPFEDTPITPGPRFEDQVYRRNVLEPDLAVLRSFVNPGLDALEVLDVLITDSTLKAAWNKPPECLFKYGDFSLACVVTDLNIKLSEFGEDALPQKADVSMTLKEQSLSTEATVDAVMRMAQSTKVYARLEGEDWLAVTPIAGSFVSAGSLFEAP